MGKLTTHVLDTAHGRPAEKLRIELFREGDNVPLVTATTNGDGRCDGPLLEGAAFEAGRYQLIFHTGTYFAGLGVEQPDPPFLDRVVIAFGIAEPGQHYHVPLLVAPYGYSTYRGS